MEFKDQFRVARRRANLTQEKLSEKLGVSRVSIANWENGIDMPEARRLKIISQTLNTSIGELFGEHPLQVRQDIAEYKVTEKKNWPAVLGTAQLGDDGYWLDFDSPPGHGDGFVTYPTRDPNAYAVRCKGDSMRPRIKPGEFVVVEPNHAYMPGDEVLVKDKRGRVMVKVFNFNRNGSIEVSSVNEDHKPITIDMADVEHIHFVAAICKSTMYYRDIL